MPRIAVVLDANVLIPAAPRDTLLRATEAGLYRLHWSDEILAEIERNLVRHHMTAPAGARDLVDEMRSFFPEAMVSDHQPLVQNMTNDVGDRHVLAVAVRAQVIVTENLRHFPTDALRPYAIEAQSIDVFLTNLYWLATEHMLRIVQQQADDLDDPPMTPLDVLSQLSRWAPTFASLLRHQI